MRNPQNTGGIVDNFGTFAAKHNRMNHEPRCMPDRQPDSTQRGFIRKNNDDAPFFWHWEVIQNPDEWLSERW